MILGFSLYCWLISCAFLNEKTEGINLKNYSPRQVASDNKW